MLEFFYFRVNGGHYVSLRDVQIQKPSKMLWLDVLLIQIYEGRWA